MRHDKIQNDTQLEIEEPIFFLFVIKIHTLWSLSLFKLYLILLILILENIFIGLTAICS